MEVIQNFVIHHLIGIRAIHIIAAALWSFHWLTAFFYLMPANNYLQAKEPANPEMIRRAYWVFERYSRASIVEKISFFVILCTGGLMFLGGVAGFSDGWFVAKMVIVLGLFMPAWIAGVWHEFVITPRMERNKDTDPEAYAYFRKTKSKLLIRNTTPILLLILFVLSLALLKPVF